VRTLLPTLVGLGEKIGRREPNVAFKRLNKSTSVELKI
jgi:hypothetical protein